VHIVRKIKLNNKLIVSEIIIEIILLHKLF